MILPFGHRDLDLHGTEPGLDGGALVGAGCRMNSRTRSELEEPDVPLEEPDVLEEPDAA